MKRAFFAFAVIAVLFFCACSEKTVNQGPKKEVASYEEKTIGQGNFRNLEVILDCSNIEVYAWPKKEIKIETAKKLRGWEDKTVLDKKMEEFKLAVTEENEKITLKSRYMEQIKNASDRSLDIKLFVPRQIRYISYKIDAGTIKVFDDIKCDFNFETKAVNAEINRFDGKLTCKTGTGNLKISGGKLRRGSYISTNLGNISIKAGIEEAGSYSFQTNAGNMDFQFPDGLKATVECLGNVEMNEFAEGNYATKVALKSGMGKISVRKYRQ